MIQKNKLKVWRDIRWGICLTFLHLTGVWAQESNRDLPQLITEQKVDTLSGGNLVYAERLNSFFDSLCDLEQEELGQLNIVHIGDSHIQADLWTGTMRSLFQNRFGNAGLGFTFPYRLAKTNGTHYVRYNSNAEWTGYRNIFPMNGAVIGLSGIALTTAQKDFVMELEVKSPEYNFTKLKIFTPDNERLFDLALSTQKVVLESPQAKRINHKITKGESLSTIARKYKVGVNEIKRINGLKTNLIRVGRTLLIPTKEKERIPIKNTDYNIQELVTRELYHEFIAASLTDRIYIRPHGDENIYNLTGLSLTNDDAGIIYHSIGVNGARFSDYNKYALFFSQLPGLSPDLLIVSLGTNESFDKLEPADFQQQLNLFITNIRNVLPQVPIILTTPTPSQLPKKQKNVYAEGYADSMQEMATTTDYAIWNAFRELGGTEGVEQLYQENLISRDYVHYTKNGYESIGSRFYEVLMEAYANYKKSLN